MTDRKVGNYAIDSNCIKPRLCKSEIEKILRWGDNGVIMLEVSFSAIIESGRGSGGQSRLSTVDNYVHLEGNNFLGEEENDKKLIENIVFPNGAKKNNEKMDIQLLYDARCSGATVITLDGNSNTQPRGILGSASELIDLCIRVLSPVDAVNEISNLIEERDKKARDNSKLFGGQLPSWVGRANQC